MSEVATLVPVSTVIAMLTAISDRSWERFKNLEADFVDQYGIEVWEDVFNFRVLPALDKESKRWFLIQKCSMGIKSVKTVA
jgi:hypothetical protein